MSSYPSLPDCPVSVLQQFLHDIKWHRSPSLSEDDKSDVWVNKGDTKHIRFRIDRKRIPLPEVSVILEIEMDEGYVLADIPFYKGKVL